MGMAHPPSLQPDFDDTSNVEIDEVLPAPHEDLVMSKDCVHFDMDPTNGKIRAYCASRICT